MLSGFELYPRWVPLLIQNSQKFVKTPKNLRKKSSNILYAIMMLVFFGILAVLSLYVKSH